jgi:hypothetical protein
MEYLKLLTRLMRRARESIFNKKICESFNVFYYFEEYFNEKKTI